MFGNIILDLVIILVLLICVKFRIESNYYVCSKCQYRFKPGFKDALKYMCSLTFKHETWYYVSNPKYHYVLKCHKCGRRFF